MDRILSFVAGCAVALVAVFVAASWPTGPTKEEVADLRATADQAVQKVGRLETRLQDAEARVKQESAAREAAEIAARQATDAAIRVEKEAAGRAADAAIRAALAREDMKKASRSERERLTDEAAARKALAATSCAPTPVTPVVALPSSAESEALYQQALAMEGDGNVKEAIRIYRRAARAGNGKAAKRVGDIFDRGAPGVSRDYAESLQWYETARQLGESVPVAVARGSCR